MATLVRCTRCGAELASGRLDGLCPVCLAAAAALGPDSRERSTAPEGVPLGVSEAGVDLPGAGASPPPGSPFTSAPELPEQIGVYRILAKIAEGGMGVVYKAEQRGPVRRVVALKVIKPGMDSREVVARFEAERQAMALMNHPNVARAFDAGMTDGGMPYFVMEYVPGEPITAYCDRQRLTVRQRLVLFTQACDAIQHAHQKAILHRDVKPSNVLVALDNGRPVVKVIDFGVAKALHQRLSEHTLFTEQGKLIGTPEYMSPEQAEMSALDVDTRTDIYSLGVLLYELVAGTLPFDSKELRRAAFDELRRIIREVEPPRPSVRLAATPPEARLAAKRRSTEPDALRRELQNELEWIPLKAMRKDRAERYRSASELADDINNYLAGRPLIAGPQSRSYRARKFLSAHARAVTGAAALFALLLGLTVALAVAARVAVVQARAAGERAFQRDAALKEATAQKKNAEERSANALAALEQAELNLARSLIAEGDYYATIGLPAEARESHFAALDLFTQHQRPGTPAVTRLLEPTRDLTPLMGTYGLKRGTGGFTGHTRVVNAVAVTPDGQTVLTACEDGMLGEWEVETGKLLGMHTEHSGSVAFVTVSPGPKGPVILSGGNDGRIISWEGSPLRPAASWKGSTDRVWVVAYSPASGQVLAGGENDTGDPDIFLWDLATQKFLRRFRGHTGSVAGLVFTRDGRHFLSASHDGTIKYWDVASETPDDGRKFEGHTKDVNCIVLSPDGDTAVSASFDGTVIVWDVATGTRIGEPLRGHAGPVWRAEFSHDARRIASGGSDGTVRLWDATTHKLLRTYSAGEGRVMGVTFLPDDSAIVASHGPGFGSDLSKNRSAVHVWDIDKSGGCLELEGCPKVIAGVCVSDAQTVLICGGDGTVGLWDLATGKKLRSLRAGIGLVSAIALSRDGSRAVVAGRDGALVLCDLKTGAEQRRTTPVGVMNRAEFLADGRAVFCGEGGQLWVWDTTTNAPLAFGPRGADLVALAVSPDSAKAWTADAGENVNEWDLAPDHTKTPVAWGFFHANRLAASPDGGALLYTHKGLQMNQLCLAVLGQKEMIPLAGHKARVTALACSHNRQLAMSGDSDGAVVAWDASANDQIKPFRVFPAAHGAAVAAVAFSPDGGCAVTAGSDGSIRLWDFNRPARQFELEGQVTDAHDQLQKQTNGPALVALGEWYAFRGRDQWAVNYLTKARAANVAVSDLTLARCYWRLGDLAKANQSFQAAAARREASATYLEMCAEATRRGKSPTTPR